MNHDQTVRLQRALMNAGANSVAGIGLVADGDWGSRSRQATRWAAENVNNMTKSQVGRFYWAFKAQKKIEGTPPNPRVVIINLLQVLGQEQEPEQLMAAAAIPEFGADAFPQGVGGLSS